MIVTFRTTLRPAGRLLSVALAACAACCPTIAVAEPATVLLYSVKSNNPNSTGNFAEADQTVSFPRDDALVFVAASGGASYAGPITGAGIRVSIRYGPKLVVTEDDMFEGQSLNMTYRASVSHVCMLPRGQSATFLAVTERLGSLGAGGGNTDTTVRLEVVAMAAELPAVPRRTCGGDFSPSQ